MWRVEAFHSGNWWSQVRYMVVKEHMSQFSLLSKRLLIKIPWFYSFSNYAICVVYLESITRSPKLVSNSAISKLGVKCVLGLVKCAVLYIQWSIVTVSILMFNNLYGISLSISDWCWRLCLLQHSCTCGWILT